MRGWWLALAVLLGCAQAGLAADRVVGLREMPKLRTGVAGLPRIAAPADAAERRINAALERLDATMRHTVAGCVDAKGRPGGWSRSVAVPMRGPGFLSLAITDLIECPGRPANVSTMAIVYDLVSGKPVDWTRLLPPVLTGKLALEAGADGTRMVTLAAPRLFALYLAGYRVDEPAGDASCRAAIGGFGENGPPAMMAWLDARAGGLAVQFDLPVALAGACGEAVVVPLAELRRAGAAARLLDAIAAAHRAG